jgi:AcrR family transcriptional regulator
MSVDLREKIIIEAANRFVASGYHAVSMREIAEASGASKAAIYYHFADKEALLLAIMDQSLTQLIGIVQRASNAQSDTISQLTAIVEGLLSLNAVQRSAMRLAMFELQHLGEIERRNFAMRYDREFIERIRAILRAGQANGIIRMVDVQASTWVLLGILYPFSVAQGRGHDTGQLSRTLVDLFLHGISTQKPG